MAAFAGVDDFNYSAGALNGNTGGSGWGAGWSGAISFLVTGASSPPGAATAKSVQGTAEDAIDRTLTAAADSGNLYVSLMQAVSIDKFVQYIGRNSSTDAFRIRLQDAGSGGDLVLVGTTTEVLIADYLVDTWYDINFQWVTTSTGKARAKLSTDTTWGAFSGAVTFSGSLTSIDKVRLEFDNVAGTGVGYYARIQNTDFTPAAADAGRNTNLALMGVGQ